MNPINVESKEIAFARWLTLAKERRLPVLDAPAELAFIAHLQASLAKAHQLSVRLLTLDQLVFRRIAARHVRLRQISERSLTPLCAVRGRCLLVLEAACDTTPLADAAARGNAFQLLGRASLPARNFVDFERAMARTEELGHQINAQTNSIHGPFNLGTVYEEYAKSYTHLAQALWA